MPCVCVFVCVFDCSCCLLDCLFVFDLFVCRCCLFVRLVGWLFCVACLLMCLLVRLL